jgi:hypothetical protein
MPKNSVFVVVYKDNENGEVDLDVFGTKERAGVQMKKTYEEIVDSLMGDQYVNELYCHEDGTITYFSTGFHEGETLYECFIREEVIQ